MNYFYIIGNGYIANAHYQAILNNNGIIKAVYDPIPRGNIDNYDIETKYFVNKKEFFKFLEKDINFSSSYRHYVVILTPNYLHYKYMVEAVNYCDVICEKPLVLNYKDYSKIMDYVIKLNEDGIKRNIYQIAQLRTYNVDNLKYLIASNNVNNIGIDYFIARGDWYNYSWKADKNKSGGILYNIGVHPIDFIIYALGIPDMQEVIKIEDKDAVLKFRYIPERLNVDLHISIRNYTASRAYYLYKNDELIATDNLVLANKHTDVYKDILTECEKSKFNIKYFNKTYQILGGLKWKK